MGDGGAVKKHVAFEDQHEADVIIGDKQKRGSASSSSFSSVSSRSSSSGSLDDDLITIEDEFHTKTPSRLSPKQPESSDLTPPCQTDHKMQGGQLTGYDSSRIPSAIFSGRPSTAGDWSVASNESLFSLHMGGNQSFSKDQVFLMHKSGELPRLDDCPSTQNSGLPSVTEVEEPRRSGVDHLLPKDDDVTESGSKPPSPIQSDDDALGNKSEECRNSASNGVSPHSECSVHSNRSFAFPVFSDDLGRNKTVRLEQNAQKSPKKRQQQAEKEGLQHAQSPRKPQKASSFGRRSWLPRCSCFSLPCK